jgi:predicted MPP superfamily phosphohydrolase
LADLVDATRKVNGFVRKVLRNELVRLPVALNDVPAMHAALAQAGIRPLVNRAVPVSIGSRDPNGLWIAGVDDPTEGKPDLAAALADVPAGAALILLAHNPDTWLEPEVERADLILSGHTHGGQIRLPLLGAAHTQGTHLTRRQAAGWFRRGQTRMFVTRGLGESIPLRFGVPPQAALIRLVFGFQHEKP